MKASPFETEPGQTDEPAPPYREPQPSPSMSVRAGTEEDERDRDPTIEEPGYGHGV